VPERIRGVRLHLLELFKRRLSPRALEFAQVIEGFGGSVGAQAEALELSHICSTHATIALITLHSKKNQAGRYAIPTPLIDQHS
jgi:hypothetical protein